MGHITAHGKENVLVIHFHFQTKELKGVRPDYEESPVTASSTSSISTTTFANTNLNDAKNSARVFNLRRSLCACFNKLDGVNDPFETPFQNFYRRTIS